LSSWGQRERGREASKSGPRVGPQSTFRAAARAGRGAGAEARCGSEARLDPAPLVPAASEPSSAWHSRLVVGEDCGDAGDVGATAGSHHAQPRGDRPGSASSAGSDSPHEAGVGTHRHLNVDPNFASRAALRSGQLVSCIDGGVENDWLLCVKARPKRGVRPNFRPPLARAPRGGHVARTSQRATLPAKQLSALYSRSLDRKKDPHLSLAARARCRDRCFPQVSERRGVAVVLPVTAVPREGIVAGKTRGLLPPKLA
jgi:hypothetical protein